MRTLTETEPNVTTVEYDVEDTNEDLSNQPTNDERPPAGSPPQARYVSGRSSDHLWGS